MSDTKVKNRMYNSYIIGFLLSIVLTFFAFLFVEKDLAQGIWLGIFLSILATFQLIIQVVFFLHLGREEKPRWNMLSFIFTLIIVFIIVAGSLWIMTNLNYNHGQTDIDSYIMDEENIYR